MKNLLSIPPQTITTYLGKQFIFCIAGSYFGYGCQDENRPIQNFVQSKISSVSLTRAAVIACGFKCTSWDFVKLAICSYTGLMAVTVFTPLWYLTLGFQARSQKLRKSDYYLLRVCPSAWKNSAPTGRIVITFDIEVFFENISKFVSSLLL